MITTLVIVFLVWLPVAALLRAVVGPGGMFTHKWKRALYLVLVAPTLFSEWLTFLLGRYATLVDKLDKVGEWFRD